MPRSFWPLVALFSVFFSSSAGANPKSLSLNEALDLAKSRNPEVRLLEEQIQSSQAKVRQALAPDTPNLSILWNDKVTLTDFSSRASTMVIFTQPLAFPGKAFVNRSIFDSQTDSLRTQRKSKVLEVTTNVRIGYLQLALAQKSIELGLEQEKWLFRALAIAKKRSKRGTPTELDYLNAEVAYHSNFNNQAELEAAEKNARSQLGILLGFNGEQEFLTEPLRIHRLALKTLLGLSENFREGSDLEKARELLLDHNPDILAARHQVKAASRTESLAWMSLLPDFQLSLGYTRYDLPGAGPAPEMTESYMGFVQMTIPLWGLFNERETIVGASHDRVAAEVSLDLVVRQAGLDLETQLTTLQSLTRTLKSYDRQLLPMAQKAYESALHNFKTGSIDFQTLADAATATRDLQLEYYSNIVRYETALANCAKLLNYELTSAD